MTQERHTDDCVTAVCAGCRVMGHPPQTLTPVPGLTVRFKLCSPPQAQPGDDEATVALVRRLDANLNEEMRTWCRQDRQFMGMLTPLQVSRLRQPAFNWLPGGCGMQWSWLAADGCLERLLSPPAAT